MTRKTVPADPSNSAKSSSPQGKVELLQDDQLDAVAGGRASSKPPIIIIGG